MPKAPVFLVVYQAGYLLGAINSNLVEGEAEEGISEKVVSGGI